MKKIILTLLFGIFLISFASATTLGTFKSGDCVNLIQTCSDCTYNNISNVLYPNSSVAIYNVAMERDDTYYNYTFCNTSTLGIYIVNGYGNLGGVKTNWNYDFGITRSGGVIEGGASNILIMAIIFMLIVGALCLFGFFRKEQKWQAKWTLFIFSFIFFLTAANIISVLIGDTLANPLLISFFDSFMAISFILFWFAFGLLAIMWFLTTIQTLLLRKTKRNLEKYE